LPKMNPACLEEKSLDLQKERYEKGKRRKRLCAGRCRAAKRYKKKKHSTLGLRSGEKGKQIRWAMFEMEKRRDQKVIQGSGKEGRVGITREKWRTAIKGREGEFIRGGKEKDSGAGAVKGTGGLEKNNTWVEKNEPVRKHELCEVTPREKVLLASRPQGVKSLCK